MCSEAFSWNQGPQWLRSVSKMPDQPEPYHMLIKGLVDQLTVQNDLLQQLIGQLPPAEESDIDGGAVLITEQIGRAHV